MEFEGIESGMDREMIQLGQQLLSDNLMHALQTMVGSFPDHEELQKIYAEIAANNEWKPAPTPIQFPF
jgi:hypothetical protein